MQEMRIFVVVVIQIIAYLCPTDAGELGSTCALDSDCAAENSRCYQKLCSCLPYYAVYNSTMCVQSTMLGFDCLVHEQCSKKVANSTCIGGICRCEPGFLQFRRHTCLTAARVGEVCYSDMHCRLWDSDTHCDFMIANLFGRCACNAPLRQSRSGTCLPNVPPPSTSTSPSLDFPYPVIMKETKNTTKTPSKPTQQKTQPVKSKPHKTTSTEKPNVNKQKPDKTKPDRSTEKPTSTTKKPEKSDKLKPNKVRPEDEQKLKPTNPSSRPNNETKQKPLLQNIETTNKPLRTRPTKPMKNVTNTLVIVKNPIRQKNDTKHEATTSQTHSLMTPATDTSKKTKNKTTTTTNRNSVKNTLFLTKQNNSEMQILLNSEVKIKNDGNEIVMVKEVTTSTTRPLLNRNAEESTAISLGYPCRTDGQCMKHDNNSRCIGGVCDCFARRTRLENACSAKNRGCHEGTFQCKSTGTCISWFFVCDGRKDCPDGSDEDCKQKSTCPEHAFRCGTSVPAICLSQASRCDGTADCPNGEDEFNCTASKQRGCPLHTFQCSDGRCLPEYEFCNAVITCDDASDEPDNLCTASWSNAVRNLGYCPFRCSNGRCRSSAVVCSGRDGCGDNSDENKCAVCRCPLIN